MARFHSFVSFSVLFMLGIEQRLFLLWSAPEDDNSLFPGSYTMSVPIQIPWIDEVLLFSSTEHHWPFLGCPLDMCWHCWSFPGVIDHEMVELRGSFTAWPKAAYLIPEARKLHELSCDLYFDSCWLCTCLLVRCPVNTAGTSAPPCRDSPFLPVWTFRNEKEQYFLGSTSRIYDVCFPTDAVQAR